MDQAALKAFFEKDRYAKACGIQIDEMAPGRAVCSFEIEDHHLNAGHAVQGGAIFTLADFTFAVAANGEVENTVSLENQITFMHSTKGKRLIATAYKVSTARQMQFYQVDVTDELGKPIARMSVTGYTLKA